MKFKKTRLQKIEERNSLRQAGIFLGLSLFLLVLLIVVGIPLVIKLSVVLGNLRSKNNTSQTVEVLAPGQPRLVPLPQATNSAQISVSGFALSGLKVKLYVNGTQASQVDTNDKGEFMVAKISLKEGSNEIKAVAISGTKESSPYIADVLYKNSPPSLEITSPADKAAFFDVDKQISVSGKTDLGVTVNVSGHLAITDPSGNFSINIPLSGGENQLKIVAVDQAGNRTEKDLTVSYTP